jgi:hypothetical protein
LGSRALKTPSQQSSLYLDIYHLKTPSAYAAKPFRRVPTRRRRTHPSRAVHVILEPGTRIAEGSAPRYVGLCRRTCASFLYRHQGLSHIPLLAFAVGPASLASSPASHGTVPGKRLFAGALLGPIRSHWGLSVLVLMLLASIDSAWRLARLGDTAMVLGISIAIDTGVSVNGWKVT